MAGVGRLGRPRPDRSIHELAASEKQPRPPQGRQPREHIDVDRTGVLAQRIAALVAGAVPGRRPHAPASSRSIALRKAPS